MTNQKKTTGMKSCLLHVSHRAAMLGVLCVFLTNCGSGSQGQAQAQTITPGIHPLTTVNETAGTGYFVDPLPIHLPATKGSYIPSISGTTKAILNCSTTLATGCYQSTPLTIAAAPLSVVAGNVGSTLAPFDNLNVYKDSNNVWQMAATAYVQNPNVNVGGAPWTVIVHASPKVVPTDGSVPTQWQADSLLVGSFTVPAAGNYDGKFIEDGSSLYLIYSMRLKAQPNSKGNEDGIVAQSMATASQVSGSAPVPLLIPENNANGGYNSEYFDCLGHALSDQFKLIETGNIAVIGGKYAMAYSTGRYNMKCYKSGVAWSDSILGPYKKVLQEDTTGVWLEGNDNEEEVVYLLQNQIQNWPNYIGNYQAPGVPSLVDYQGTWYMYFAAFDPTDEPPASVSQGGTWDGSHRRPYFIRLDQAVPQNGVTVSGTTNENLARWLTIATQ
jgi:hypothetical protein